MARKSANLLGKTVHRFRRTGLAASGEEVEEELGTTSTFRGQGLLVPTPKSIHPGAGAHEYVWVAD